MFPIPNNISLFFFPSHIHLVSSYVFSRLLLFRNSDLGPPSTPPPPSHRPLTPDLSANLCSVRAREGWFSIFFRSLSTCVEVSNFRVNSQPTRRMWCSGNIKPFQGFARSSILRMRIFFADSARPAFVVSRRGHTRKQIKLIRSGHPCARKCATDGKVRVTRWLLVGCSSPFTRPDKHLTALRAWSTRCLRGRLKTRHAPSRHSRDAKVYALKTTAMHEMSTPPPPFFAMVLWLRPCTI